MKHKRYSAILALLCVFVLVLSLLPSAAFAAEEATEQTDAEREDLTEGQLIIPVSDEEEDADRKELIIRTAEDFEAFARKCRNSVWSVGLTVRLEADIDFGGRAVMPVPSFSGRFFGNGHTIKNFVCAANGSHQGLFRFLESTGQIITLNVTGEVTPEGSRGSVGGIVGTNRGLVVGCSFSGTVDGLISVGGIVGENLGQISRCKASGHISGKHFTGGIAGYNEGTIRSCTNEAEVNIEVRDEGVDIESLDIRDIIGVNLVSIEDGDSVSDVGGIAGISLGNVLKCTNNGVVGYQHYGYNVGGIVGRQSGFMEECVNNGTVFGRKDVGGIAGQMEPYLILDDSSSLVDEITALQEAMDTAMSNMDSNSAGLGSSAKQVRDSGESIGTHYADEYLDTETEEDKEAERQARRERVNEGVSTAGSKAGETADALGDDTIGNITSGNLTDSDYEKIGTVGGDLAVEGGTALGDRIDARRAEREQEQAEQEAERARLQAQYASLANGLNSMGQTLHGTLASLASDMKNVTEHYSNILTMLTNALSGNLELRVMEDISDLDTDEDTGGKVLNCVNYGEVNGDTNIGGITGSMGVEAEFDMEGLLSAKITDTIKISTESYFARCIVRKCINEGLINAKKDYVGGICGLAELGVISSSENYGDIDAGGDYSGGVVGHSKSIVTGSYAMCEVVGTECVGGIAGQGTRVINCSAIAYIDETSACSGAICGWVDVSDPALFIYRNTFVSDSLGGVDGISYTGAAEPVTYRKLARTEGLPERFKSLKVSFRAEGLVVRELTIPYGGSVAARDIPAVPEISGYSGFWPETNLKKLTSSITVDAVYLDRLTGIAADKTREGSPLSLVIVEGLFEPGSKASITDWSEEISPLKSYRLCEAWTLHLSSQTADSEEYSVHYLLPETSFLNGQPLLFVKGENGLEPQEYSIDGSYMIFDATGSDLSFCVLARELDLKYPVIVGSVLALLAVLAVLLIRRKRRARKAELDEAASAAVEGSRTDSENEEEKKEPVSPIP